MFRTLDLCRPLIEKLLAEAIQIAKNEEAEKAAKVALLEPEISERFTVQINEHALRVDLWVYNGEDRELWDASRVYNQGEQVGEYGPFECDGFHSQATYRGVNQVVEIARQILQTEIDETTREQTCQIEHLGYGQRISVKSRVFVEKGQLVWELIINDRVQRGSEVCTDGSEGWQRLARMAAQRWRDAVGEQLAPFVVHLGDDE